jgi:hypothetical protein
MPEAPFGHLSCHRTRALMGAKAIYQTVSEGAFSETHMQPDESLCVRSEVKRLFAFR